MLFVTIYPVPAWPYNITPYLFLAALIAGFIYMQRLESRKPGALRRGATMMVGSRSTAEGDVDWDKPSTATSTFPWDRQPHCDSREIIPSRPCAKAAVCDASHREAFHPHTAIDDNGPKSRSAIKIRCKKDAMSFGSLVFTPSSRSYRNATEAASLQRIEKTTQNRFTDYETEFLAERDSFYWATLGATGWPYIQHRGGPGKGLLKVINDHTLALADFRGNKQYISTGNLLTEQRRGHHPVGLSPPGPPQNVRGRKSIFSRASKRERLAGPCPGSRLSSCDRKSLRHPCRTLRLELPATHHAAIYRGRNPRVHGWNIKQRMDTLEKENAALRAELAKGRELR